jgi:nucleotide-binding universal stress UspA family protein
MNERDKRIVVGVDGTEESGRLLRWAGSLAKALDAEVVAVHALTPVGEFTLSLPPFPPTNLRRAFQAELEDHWCAPLREIGVPYRALIVESGPVSALLQVSEQERADFIVVGGHGHTTFTDHIVGSVAARLVHRGTTPVVVVPTTTDAPAFDPSGQRGRLDHDHPRDAEAVGAHAEGG